MLSAASPRRRVIAGVCAAWFAVVALAQDGDALAIVNGRPISRQRVVDLLIESHGLEILQQLIVLELAKEGTKARGLAVSAADVDAEFRDSLDKLLSALPGGGNLNDAARRQALQSVLDERGLSMAEFMVGMERNAHLRKMCEQDLKLTDDDLRAEFGRSYGERIRARQIVLADATGVREAVEALNGGIEFADVAGRLSADATTAGGGGEMPPFSADDVGVPAAVREAAFALKDGEVSNAIRIDDKFYIIKVEGRIAPENVRFEDVRDVLTVKLKARLLPQRMSALATELFKQAKVRVLDLRLREQYEELLKKNAASGGP